MPNIALQTFQGLKEDVTGGTEPLEPWEKLRKSSKCWKRVKGCSTSYKSAEVRRISSSNGSYRLCPPKPKVAGSTPAGNTDFCKSLLNHNLRLRIWIKRANQTPKHRENRLVADARWITHLVSDDEVFVALSLRYGP
jgi:hypothetical protein